MPGATFKAPYVMLLCYRALKGLFLLQQEEAHLMYYYLVNGLSAAADAGLILRDCTPFNLPLSFLRSAKYLRTQWASFRSEIVLRILKG